MGEIRCPLAGAAEKYSDSPALIGPDRTISYSQYHRLVTQAGYTLTELGFSRGDRVTFVSENSVNLCIFFMAAMRSGIVACPLSTRLPDDTIRAAISELQARQFNVEDYEFDNLVTAPQPDAVVDLEQPSTVIFTSGSASQPKAVLHTYGNHYYSALGSNLNIPLDQTDRWLLSLPLYHVGGLAILFRALLAGAAVVVPEPDEELSALILSLDVTHLSLVHTQLYRLLQSNVDSVALSRQLKAVLVGGSAVSRELCEKASALGFPVFKSYGLTEMASQVTTTAPGDIFGRSHTSGKPLKYREIAVSEDGELLVRGETLFSGYFEGEAVNSAIDNEGWFSTGDCGYFDDDGYLVVTGRQDNLFISGGENIQPEEIEQALCELQSVETAVVVPVENAEFGFRPVAFVRFSGDTHPDTDALSDALENSLPRFKIPDAFYSWPEGVTSIGIKIGRSEFKKLAEKLASAGK